MKPRRATAGRSAPTLLDWCLLMHAAMSETPVSPRPDRRWPWGLAVAFIVLTLVALVLVPYAVQLRVDRLRSTIVASEPARTVVMQWQIDLVREIVALSELALTGDTAQLAVYGAAYADERSMHAALASLVARLGPEVRMAYEEARDLANEWHARVDGAALGGASVIPARERALFEEVVRAVVRVDGAILRMTARARTRIMAVEQHGLRLTLVLGALALLAAVGVITLETRMRRFAAEAERQRSEAAAALAATARAAEGRARLLRGITHDVKNPLGTAKGYAELLEMEIKAPLAPEQAPLVEGVLRSIDSALAIIADLLDLARADSSGVSVQRVEVDLDAIARDAAADHDAAARAAGHTIGTDATPTPLIAHTDPARVRQVLDNLLSNAIKYTPAPGRIMVRARATQDDGAPRPGSWAVIQVSDTGPGIPPEQRDAVFDEFTRLQENSPTKGHGLGLAIARGLSRRLGGDLTIADTTSGATFVLWIPQRDT